MGAKHLGPLIVIAVLAVYVCEVLQPFKVRASVIVIVTLTVYGRKVHKVPL